MSELTIRAKIKSVLQGVSGIGVVHDYIRESRSPAKFIDLMTPEGAITVNGWMFSRISTTSEWEGFSSRILTHLFNIVGYFEVDDENGSEKTFQGIISGIADACDGSSDLNTIDPAPPLQVSAVDHEEIEGRDYHHCVLTLSVAEVL